MGGILGGAVTEEIVALINEVIENQNKNDVKQTVSLLLPEIEIIISIVVKEHFKAIAEFILLNSGGEKDAKDSGPEKIL